jgi:3-hydroxymyristoyl/3-hydroxydecanoyl-(acyl carrier protein) dehydratase
MSSCFLPRVLSEHRDNDALLLQLHLPEAAPCFDGHFPDFPVLPGVLQIHWAMLFGRDKLGVHGEFRSLQQIKFSDIVEPGAALTLRLSWDEDGGRLSFDYRADGRKASSGRIQLV